MNVLSMEAYKKNKGSLLSSSDTTIVSLPIAPMVLFRTRFAREEKVKSQALLPQEVLGYLDCQDGVAPEKEFVVAVSGPGDPLATPNDTVGVVKEVKQQYPKARCALRTLGVGASELASPLVDAGVDYVELITNGFTIDILESTYTWIRPGRKTLPLKKAGELLIKEQKDAVAAFKETGVTVCGNITWFDETDTKEFDHTCQTLKELGVETISLTIDRESEGSELRNSLRARAEKYLPVVDALPDWQTTIKGNGQEVDGPNANLPKPSKQKPNVAVVSTNGMDVDLHLGQAKKILVYGPREDGLACLLETRQAPPGGGGGLRWQKLAELLSDCFVLLAASAGDKPRSVLADHGIKVLVVNDPIEGCVDVLYGGGKKKKCKK